MNAEFIDTNILVYAHDKSAGGKRRIAIDLIKRLLKEKTGCLSIQVLLELFVTLTRKVPSPLSHEVTTEIIADLSTWQTFAPQTADVLEALGLAAKFQISIWDAMILHAASALQATIIWSEDLNHGQVYNGVEVRNPFRS